MSAGSEQSTVRLGLITWLGMLLPISQHLCQKQMRRDILHFQIVIRMLRRYPLLQDTCLYPGMPTFGKFGDKGRAGSIQQENRTRIRPAMNLTTEEARNSSRKKQQDRPFRETAWEPVAV